MGEIETVDCEAKEWGYRCWTDGAAVLKKKCKKYLLRIGVEIPTNMLIFCNLTYIALNQSS